MSKYRKMAALNPFAFLRRSAAPVAALLACTALQASAEIVYHEDFEGDPAKWPISVIYRGAEPGKWIHVPSKEAAFGRRALYLEASDEAQWMFRWPIFRRSGFTAGRYVLPHGAKAISP